LKVRVLVVAPPLDGLVSVSVAIRPPWGKVQIFNANNRARVRQGEENCRARVSNAIETRLTLKPLS
jgi:hypothetical protein